MEGDQGTRELAIFIKLAEQRSRRLVQGLNTQFAHRLFEF